MYETKAGKTSTYKPIAGLTHLFPQSWENRVFMLKSMKWSALCKLNYQTVLDRRYFLEIAVEEFNSDYLGVSLQSYVIGSLLFADRFDTAIELLDLVRDEIKLSEQIDIGLELVKHDRLDDALNLADSISREDRIDYFYFVASRAVIFSRTSKVLEMIARVPATELQSAVAARLLNQGSTAQDFTREQLETLRSYVSE